MSIIYDALQKTQKKRDDQKDENSSSSANKTKRIYFAGTLTSMCVFVLGAMALCTLVLKNHHVVSPPKSIVSQVKKTEPKIPPINLTEYKKNHILRGVFLSNNEKVAMINDEIYHTGNMVDGMKLVHIDLDGVKLIRMNQVLILRTNM